jgi:hypothetical protein
MSWITAPTFWAEVCIAGDIEQAKQVCREECFCDGLCVTIEPCEYIYTGGQETGYRVRLINYPQFPSTPGAILGRALALAELLMARTCQWSALVMTPTETHWITRREDCADKARKA